MNIVANAEYVCDQLIKTTHQGVEPIKLNIIECASDDQIEEELIEIVKTNISNTLHADKTRM